MNGIQSLMQGAPTQRPQQPQPQQAGPRPAPAQNDPRMAAAMDVVKNDVPEPLQNLVSENEFAQKAMELLQSAGGQAAMNQPPATPPTVKQRVDQQAMEGVAGLLQRLAPGMQQRGQQVQSQQARQMLGGGMPTMGAPNMARMAMGGIVGYQAGGDIMGPPEPNMLQRMGQGLKNYGANAQESMGILQEAKAGMGVPYEDRSAVMKQVRDEIAAQNQSRDPNFIERMGQKLMGVGLNVEESKAILKQFYDNMGKTYEQKASGMAMGGEVKRFQAGMEVELDEDLIASLLAQQPEPTGYTGPSAEERRAASEAALAQAREARRAEERTRQELRERGLSGPEINRYLSSRLDAVEPGGIGELKQPQFDTRSPQTGSFPQRLMDDTSVGTAEGGRGAPQTDVARTLESITGLQVPSADISSLPRSPLRDPLETTALKNIARDPEAERLAEESRKQTQAAAAYAMSPELRAAYAADRAKRDEYYTAQLDPKRQRNQKLNALLAGFATPGGIARSGIAALQGTTGVDDAALEMQRKQAEEDFARTKEQAGIESEGRAKSFETASAAGQSAFERASAGLNQASQSLSQLATSDETRAQAASVQDYTRQMDALKSQLNVFLQQEKLAEDDKRTAAKLVSDIRRAQSAKDDTILDIQNSMIVYTPEQRTAAERLIQQAQAEKALLQEDINSLAFKLGLPVNIPAASGASGASGAVEAADYFK